ncbi:MAG: endonuclease/exonuclease/phosphatase family protein [Vicinamibacterales bacterium]|nr:endonuclease/exonuclease/phosphatase family protein [Vicinamibacterales bacterium]
MRAVTSSVLAAFAVIGLTMVGAAPFVTAQAPPAPGEPLTVMSFNIRYGTANDGDNHWLKRREQLFELLRAQRADVIGVQEALRGQLDEILAAVPGYAYVGVGRADGRQAGEYAAVLYRTDRFQVRRSDTFWLSETPGVVKSTSWGNRIERVCTWAYVEDRLGPSFFVYNVHLDHESQPSRERSVALLLATIAARDPRGPVVVTGDFNAGEQNPATVAMRGAFQDSFRLRFPDEREVGTFSGFKPDQTTGDKIDYVFVEPGTEVLDASIVRTARDGRGPSDHFPVTARVRLR